jgi:hypothetical protein
MKRQVLAPATYLLASACHHLWPVPLTAHKDGSSLALAIPLVPSTRFRLVLAEMLRSHDRGTQGVATFSVHCPRGFAPGRYQPRTPR